MNRCPHCGGLSLILDYEPAIMIGDFVLSKGNLSILCLLCSRRFKVSNRQRHIAIKSEVGRSCYAIGNNKSNGYRVNDLGNRMGWRLRL